MSTRILYNSRRDDYNRTNAIRPVVEIDLNWVNIGKTGDGSRDNPYSIS